MKFVLELIVAGIFALSTVYVIPNHREINEDGQFDEFEDKAERHFKARFNASIPLTIESNNFRALSKVKSWQNLSYEFF